MFTEKEIDAWGKAIENKLPCSNNVQESFVFAARDIRATAKAYVSLVEKIKGVEVNQDGLYECPAHDMNYGMGWNDCLKKIKAFIAN